VVAICEVLPGLWSILHSCSAGRAFAPHGSPQQPERMLESLQPLSGTYCRAYEETLLIQIVSGCVHPSRVHSRIMTKPD
jgi:hypothetical protein